MDETCFTCGGQMDDMGTYGKFMGVDWDGEVHFSEEGDLFGCVVCRKIWFRPKLGIIQQGVPQYDENNVLHVL